ncbi:hypothetical protein PRUB_a3765 [Pseudoalteromonas rubra]|uniref:Uncharacterized protein n=1 Tax=Pseudoalteromonas rubra TaxID=43658 RepID=A0A8T0CA52_9GAMM|nr:hypothetical protein [Pseudoalteromonas rubra]KAF7786942.1 hypothetical protein PRUB_a3765 [Pseudoalteromonas rubra]
MDNKYIIFYFIFFFLTGCASKVQVEDVTSKRIGYVPPVGYKNVLCHYYTGFTVFHNDSARHKLTVPLSELHNQALKSGIEQKSGVPIFTGEISVLNDAMHAQFSNIDHSITFSKEAEHLIHSKMEELDLEYLIFSRHLKSNADKSCALFVSSGSQEYNGKMAMMSSSLKLYLLRRTEGELRFVLDRFGGGQSHSEQFEPKNLKELTIQDVEKYQALFVFGLAEDIVKLLNGELYR